MGFANGVLAEYRSTINGIQVPHRKVWQQQQKKLDLANKLLEGGKYSVLEYLTWMKHVTPNFKTLRPTNLLRLYEATSRQPLSPTVQALLPIQPLVPYLARLPSSHIQHQLHTQMFQNVQDWYRQRRGVQSNIPTGL